MSVNSPGQAGRETLARDYGDGDGRNRMMGELYCASEVRSFEVRVCKRVFCVSSVKLYSMNWLVHYVLCVILYCVLVSFTKLPS